MADPMLKDTRNASWATLPRKSQLMLLAACRFAEPLSNTSVLSYLYYLLKSFDETLTADEIVRRAGFVATSFALGQFLTGTFWGSLSDRIGRKSILIIGLGGTVISTLVFGFSQNIYTVIVTRFLAGSVNGNVGVLRTMVSEIVVEKKHQSRAFLIMPMCFNVGAIIGPIIGGLLADPTAPGSALHWLVGADSVLGGKTGVLWLQKYRYALPNVVSAVFLSCSFLLCWMYLEETLPEVAGQRDSGRVIGQALIRFVRNLGLSRKPSSGAEYMALEHSPVQSPTAQEHPYGSPRASNDTLYDEESESPDTARLLATEHNAETENLQAALQNTLDTSSSRTSMDVPKKLAYSEIFTRNVIFTLISFMVCPLHNATFMQLWPLFLSTPTSPNLISLPFKFSGGLGLSTSSVGYAMSVLGCIGIALQLLVFPHVQARFGTLTCYQVSLWIFPIAYILIPFLAVLPSPTKEYASGTTVWTGIVLLLLVQVIARTFAIPSTVILLNNSSPSPRCLGTIHGVGSSLSSLSRVVGPLTGAFLLGYGVQVGVIGLVWWILALVAICGAVFSLFIYEGEGSDSSSTPVETRRSK